MLLPLHEIRFLVGSKDGALFFSMTVMRTIGNISFKCECNAKEKLQT